MNRFSNKLFSLKNSSSNKLISIRSSSIIFKRSFSSTTSESTTNQQVDGIVCGVFSNRRGTGFFDKINAQSNQRIEKMLNLANGFEGKKGQSIILFDPQATDPQHQRIAIVGLGKEKQVEDRTNEIREAAYRGVKALMSQKAMKIGVESFGDNRASAEGAILATHKYKGPNYDFEEDSNNNNNDTNSLNSAADKINQRPTKLSIVPQEISTGLFLNEWKKGVIMAESENWTKTMSATPSNQLTPTKFVEEAEKLLKETNNPNLTINAHDESWAREKKMGMFLGVSQGSKEPLKFLEVHYNGAQDKKLQPLVLVGKGITFDTGGISIKPSSGMEMMKGDMTGAAAVISTIRALAALKIPLNVIGLTPLCENMPSGKAIKPGDVVRASNGKWVEVDNTDAEGRLILGDALHYAHSFNPHTIVDVATLTGAIVVALGSLPYGAYSNNFELWKDAERSGEITGEPMWRMPLKDYSIKAMKSQVAHMRNTTGKREAGSPYAATFLKQFVNHPRWLHLDIAGAYHISPEQGIYKDYTGIPTRALIELATIIHNRHYQNGNYSFVYSKMLSDDE